MSDTATQSAGVNRSKMIVSETDVAIEISNMNKWYGDFHVLRDINLKVMRGEHGPLPPSVSAGLHELIKSLLTVSTDRRPSLSSPRQKTLTPCKWARTLTPEHTPCARKAGKGGKADNLVSPTFLEGDGLCVEPFRLCSYLQHFSRMVWGVRSLPVMTRIIVPS